MFDESKLPKLSEVRAWDAILPATMTDGRLAITGEPLHGPMTITGETPKANVFLTSDLHLGHANILRYCRRDFADVEEMDRALIENWNQVVDDEDTVYVLGDFALCKVDALPGYVSALKGHKILIKGNHDRSAEVMLAAGFEAVHENIIVEIDGKRVWMNHYPNQPDYRDRTRLQRPKAPGKFDISLGGHTHDNYVKLTGPDGVQWVNVGSDCHDFTPITLDRAFEFLRGRDRVRYAQMLLNGLSARKYLIADQGLDTVHVVRQGVALQITLVNRIACDGDDADFLATLRYDVAEILRSFEKSDAFGNEVEE